MRAKFVDRGLTIAGIPIDEDWGVGYGTVFDVAGFVSHRDGLMVVVVHNGAFLAIDAETFEPVIERPE